MSDDLVKRLRDTPNWMREGFQDWKDNVRTYDRAPFEAADRIEELEANRLANKIAIMRLEAELRKFTEIGNTQKKPADLGAGLSNSVNDTAP